MYIYLWRKFLWTKYTVQVIYMPKMLSPVLCKITSLLMSSIGYGLLHDVAHTEFIFQTVSRRKSGSKQQKNIVSLQVLD